jgi:hypothetical protein
VGRGYGGHGYGGYGHGGHGYGYGYGALGLGLGLGLAYGLDGPWAYGDPAYYDYDEGYSGDAYGAPPPQYQAQPGQACGSWVWDPGARQYNWAPC